MGSVWADCALHVPEASVQLRLSLQIHTKRHILPKDQSLRSDVYPLSDMRALLVRRLFLLLPASVYVGVDVCFCWCKHPLFVIFDIRILRLSASIGFGVDIRFSFRIVDIRFLLVPTSFLSLTTSVFRTCRLTFFWSRHRFFLLCTSIFDNVVLYLSNAAFERKSRLRCSERACKETPP